MHYFVRHIEVIVYMLCVWVCVGELIDDSVPTVDIESF